MENVGLIVTGRVVRAEFSSAKAIREAAAAIHTWGVTSGCHWI